VTALYLPNVGKANIRCQGGCKRTLEDLWIQDRTQSMFAHFCEGEMIMLCSRCSDRYSASQMNGLYKGTVFQTVANGIFTPFEKMKKAFDKAARQGRRMFGR
jgi:hypothetical protein